MLKKDCKFAKAMEMANKNTSTLNVERTKTLLSLSHNYHMITYVCDWRIRNKIANYIVEYQYTHRMDNQSVQSIAMQTILTDLTCDNIPEFIINLYHEYCEPLVGPSN